MYLKTITFCLIFVISVRATEPEHESPKPLSGNVVGSFEAEEGRIVGKIRIRTDADPKEGYSGTGYLDAFQDDSRVEFDIVFPQDGFYDLNFILRSGPNNWKGNKVYVDGKYVDWVGVAEGKFVDSILPRVYMTAGPHVVALVKDMGWISFDKLIVTESDPLPDDLYRVSATPINPNADENVRRLMQFLADNYGKRTLTGLYAAGINSDEFRVVRNTTGRYPAIIGMDFINATPSRGSSERVADLAIEFDKAGGIVTICWHWSLPAQYGNNFYSSGTTIDLNKVFDGSDKAGYDLLISDIDVISGQLKKMQNAGVPILWRPLHEAAGRWFWWGKDGPEPYKKLWKLMYDRMTNKHKLNNLVWVWNGQGKDWYPGDDLLDIIGDDIYAGDRNTNPLTKSFLQNVQYTPTRKMIALTENGTLYDPDLAIRNETMWSFYACWFGSVARPRGQNNEEVYREPGFSDVHNDLEMFRKVYGHESMLTLDELPDLKTYPITERPAKESRNSKIVHTSRYWKSRNGKYTVEAVFVSRDNNRVTLKKADGATIDVEISKLSDQDKEYILKSGD